MSGTRRVYVTVALDVDRGWYDGLADLDDRYPRSQDCLADDFEASLNLAMRDGYFWRDGLVTVVRCGGSETL